MKNIKKIASYIVVSGLAILGIWLLKKGSYDKGYVDEKEERLFLVDAVLSLRNMPVTIDNRNKLNALSVQDLMNELGLKKDKDGNYIDELPSN